MAQRSSSPVRPLIGVPSSGAYLVKELLLQAASEAQQW
jgi:hypothetical protein